MKLIEITNRNSKAQRYIDKGRALDKLKRERRMILAAYAVVVLGLFAYVVLELLNLIK